MMMHPVQWTACLLVSILCLPVTGQAQDGVATDPFDAGNAAFRAGEYEQALTYYEQAKSAGRDSPALTYNLGVTHYRLGNYRASDGLFRELVDDPRWRDLARYNLGRVAERRGRGREAVRWYRRVHAETTDDGLRSLTAERLEALDASAPRTTPRRGRMGFLGIGTGFDGNVVAFPDTLLADASEGEDRFIEAMAYGETGIAGDWRLYGMAYTRRYAEFDAFDANVAGAGLLRPVDAGDWRYEFGAGGTYASVDGERISTEWQFRAAASREAGAHRLRFVIRPAFHSAGAGFEHVDGTSHRADVQWRYRAAGWRFTAGYRFEVNDRDDLETETEFFSHSPVRQRLKVEAGKTAGSWWFAGGASRETGRFRGINRMSDVDDVFREQRRRSTRNEGWLRGEFAMSPRSALTGEVRYTDQDDTFEFYRYDRATFTLGIEFRIH